MTETAKLGLPLLAAAQAQKHVTHNEALVALDTLVQLSVLDKDLSAPPGETDEGDSYIVASGASGAWSGWTNRIARFQDGGWVSFVPGPGWLAWAIDEARLYRFDDDWALAAVGDVIGPASAADGDFAGFDGTSGKLLKSLGFGIEVGTWQPRLIGHLSDGDYSYSEQAGHYARCGPLVLIVSWMVISAVNSAGSGQLRVTDLPFALGGTGFMMPGMVTRVINPNSVPANFAGWVAAGATSATLQIRYNRADTAEHANVNIQDVVKVGTDIRVAALHIL